MSQPQQIVLCTCPDPETADRLAAAAVDRRQAACVNIVPGLTSVFRWEGRVEREAEVLLVIKTTAAGYPALERTLCELHPYELPEVVAVDIETGLSGFLRWMDESVESE